MKDYVMSQMQKVFPELQWVELPYSHEIFAKPYHFPEGLPKIHEHDNKPPQAFAMIYEGRMVCLLTYECDLGDGWEELLRHGIKEVYALMAEVEDLPKEERVAYCMQNADALLAVVGEKIANCLLA
jgi:hypothetical protein